MSQTFLSVLVICLLTKYMDFVMSKEDEAACVDWMELKFPDEYYVRDNMYMVSETEKMAARFVHPCLLALHLETDPKLVSIAVTFESPDEDPWTQERPAATIPSADYGVYGNLSGYEEPAYHLGRLPMDVDQLNTSFILVDGNLKNVHQIYQPEDISRYVRPIKYEHVYVIAHDFNHDPSAEPNRLDTLIGLLLKYKISYKRSLSLIVTRFILSAKVWAHKFCISPPGHSRKTNTSLETICLRAGRLTALDPMAAHFEGFRPLFGEWPHVSKLDATRVDVITTSASQTFGFNLDPLNGFVGMKQSVGFKHFYVNGGSEQPNCIRGMPGSEVDAVDFCHHEKALSYFMASLKNDTEQESLLARRTSSYTAFLQETQMGLKIDSSRLSYLGIEAFSGNDLDGDYYITIDIEDDLTLHSLPAYFTPTNDKGNAAKRLLRVPQYSYMPDTLDVYLDHSVIQASLSDSDSKACGKFRQDPKQGQDGRVFRGQLPYPGQFPWAVCILTFNTNEWLRWCSGAILNRNWILTAAHCFKQPDYIPIYVTYGTDQCLEASSGTFREVVIKRDTTVFIHPRYAGQSAYDVALIRLMEPIEEVPSGDEDYTGGLINSVCFHTNRRYRSLFDQRIYVPGFGSKGPNSTRDGDLTWTYGYSSQEVMEPSFQAIFPRSVLEATRTDLFEYYNNAEGKVVCGGDSGSSYLWYVDTEDQKVANVSKYRAVSISIVKSSVESCDFHFFNDYTGLGIGASMAVKMYHPEIYGWIVYTMDMRDALRSVAAPQASRETSSWPLPNFVEEYYLSMYM
ncbi:U21-ctenitoxin-Pn1a [Halotydeus destructor]|nr:U21-ctenitoxin-Pn1a [Halotydeus destructor]